MTPEGCAAERQGRRGHAHAPRPLSDRSLMARFGNVEVRPLGGGTGCLAMLVFSLVASLVLTVLVNLVL